MTTWSTLGAYEAVSFRTRSSDIWRDRLFGSMWQAVQGLTRPIEEFWAETDAEEGEE